MIVDDEIEIGKIVQDLLAKLGFNTGFAGNGKNALEKLRNEDYTFLITDINIPKLNGIELIKIVKKEIPRINIIAMTGYDKDYTYMDVINAGASDFISKPFKIDEMEAKIKRVLIETETRDELARLSITDNLTGLYNQRHFYNRLKEEIDRANRQKHPLSLILLDLDNFKYFNDKYGHLAGDQMLAAAGKVILSNIRDSVDTAFRYGGDEFSVILVEADSTIAQTISERLKKGFQQDSAVTASIGFATYQKGMELTELIGLADKDLYSTKNNKVH
ncbi:MAG: diguanylate cyclase [Thermoplasmatales archaeon]|nr:diguanylate cyclase [Thermoplasmatales archaeon]